MEQKKDYQKNTSRKFNLKILIPSLIAIAIIYFIASYMISIGFFKESKIVYCYFDKEIPNEILPRHECGILKIVTKELDVIDLDELERLNASAKCSESMDDLPECAGDTYHFARFELKDFCEVQPCDVEGIICGGYYITYKEGYDSLFREDFEQAMFTEPNVASGTAIKNKIKECQLPTHK